MKLKLLLLFLFVVSCGVLLKAQTTKPYNKLLITEARINGTTQNYVEVTNVGNETIDLADFEIMKITPWPPSVDGVAQNFTPGNENDHFRLHQPDMYPNNAKMLAKRYLAPGKSFLIHGASDFAEKMWLKDPLHYSQRSTKIQVFTVADLILHVKEPNGVAPLDSVTPRWNFIEMWHGYCALALRHHFINTEGKKDSMIIDQFNGNFDSENGTNISTDDRGYDVAGVTRATNNSILVRKFSVKQGITDFSSHDANLAAATVQFKNAKGIDLTDSEWFPVPQQGGEESWKALYWTAGNHADIQLNENLLKPKNSKVKVDLAARKITVPWGVRDNDSLMFQFEKRPALAWKYKLSTNSQADSATISATPGDTLILYLAGANPQIVKFGIDVFPPTADDNIVIPKNGFDYTEMRYDPNWMQAYNAGWGRQGLEVTDKAPGMDSIRGLNYGTRIDTLYKYLEKAPKATWKVIPKSGIERPDLQTGDILRVTSESGKAKDYFVKLFPFYPSADAYIEAVTWPDMPSWFRGDIAKSYGWKGDTIPGFSPSNLNYVLRIPAEIAGIPALIFHKQQLDSKVTVKRATSFTGTPESRTATFTCVAEDDSTTRVYAVRFEKEKDPENIQPWQGEPFISQWTYKDDWANDFLEIVNPGTEPLDMSRYMFVFAWGPEVGSWSWNNAPTEFGNAYLKYVPGKKWVDASQWSVTPRVLVPDLATNAIVYPGDVFVMGNMASLRNTANGHMDKYLNEVDIEFRKNPWGVNVGGNNILNQWQGNWGGNIFMYKILNDSVVNGLKAATDRNDFELLEMLGNNNDGSAFAIAGKNHDAITGYYRKPGIYKPAGSERAVAKATYGTNKDDSEWYYTDWPYFQKLNYGWPAQITAISDGLGSHVMDEVTIYKSTVSSSVYKVSAGYGMNESIKGLKTGTTVTEFYQNLLKANPLQSIKVKNAAGTELAETAAVSIGDKLIVLSADSTNTSQYVLDVSATGLSGNATLTSANYTIEVTGATGKVGGFKQRTLLKTVLEGVTAPAGATLTIIDANDAYMSLSKLNYDTAYVNVIATDKVFFEVIAENGTTKVLYQLMPSANPSEAYVTSDIYSVDQFASLIQFIPPGTSVNTLLANVTPAPGATLQVFDKAGYNRTLGDIYRDDKLVVTSKDGKVTKAYYFSMNNFNVNKYLAFVISDDYQIDQVKHTIVGPKTKTTLGEFYAKLYPSFGASLSVVDKTGKVSTLADLSLGDKLIVTAADGKTTATYDISVDITNVAPITEMIKMFPNPTLGRVTIDGLTKGNRVQVFNAAGVTLRDVIVEQSTEYVSLSTQPAGIYIFVISSGEQHLNIQKIVKK